MAISEQNTDKGMWEKISPMNMQLFSWGILVCLNWWSNGGMKLDQGMLSGECMSNVWNVLFAGGSRQESIRFWVASCSSPSLGFMMESVGF